jgi:4'-phosphopantetheinyl transferase
MYERLTVPEPAPQLDDLRPGRMTVPGCSWGPPPGVVALAGGEVHVWGAVLDQPPSQVLRLAHTLSADEHARADRYFFARDRQHYIVGRGLLRAILGRYLGSEPARLRFAYSSHGKPSLAEPSGGGILHFNVSHSKGLGLYAVARDRQIGVDLERVRPLPDAAQLAERFFSPREYAALRALPAHMRHEAFFNCWTRKEAYVKARGEGLSLPLDQFDVSLARGKPARLLCNEREPRDVIRWTLQELTPAPGYAAALAVQGYGWQSRCWQWKG